LTDCSRCRYLNADARTCYWHKLLTELSKLLQYQPGKTEGRTFMEYYKPIDSYLDEFAKSYDSRGYIDNFSP